MGVIGVGVGVMGRGKQAVRDRGEGGEGVVRCEGAVEVEEEEEHGCWGWGWVGRHHLSRRGGGGLVGFFSLFLIWGVSDGLGSLSLREGVGGMEGEMDRQRESEIFCSFGRISMYGLEYLD